MEVEGPWGDMQGSHRGWGPRVCSGPPETCRLELQLQPFHGKEPPAGQSTTGYKRGVEHTAFCPFSDFPGGRCPLFQGVSLSFFFFLTFLPHLLTTHCSQCPLMSPVAPDVPQAPRCPKHVPSTAPVVTSIFSPKMGLPQRPWCCPGVSPQCPLLTWGHSWGQSRLP